MAAERDFELAEQMENNALRLSLEWSRIEPAEGHWDSAAIDRYRAILSDLRRRYMTPVVTLHHFTDPRWFADLGGFANEANISYFVRYTVYAVQALKDLCDFWITLNEPNVYAVLGYVIGSYPPGEQNMMHAFQVMHNMAQAHVEAFYALRPLQPEGQIGSCLNYRLFDPANYLSPLDRSAAGLQETFYNWAPLEAMETGRFIFPLNMMLNPIEYAAGTRDFHGINYYTREMVRFDPSIPNELFGRRFVRSGAIRNDPGLDNYFGEIYPKGMIHRAISEGIPVRGYLHWTLVDNFEWNEGWSARFGLIELDLLTQRRIPRSSASMFGEICRANAITEAIVERYAPEAAEAIFGTGTVIERQVPA